ncbi:MAG: hypothetical protein ABIP51_14095 [Bacteroidia bacterium]
MSPSKHTLVFILLALLMSVGGCKKYPEGPSFTLLTKKDRLCVRWKLEKGFVNGVERKDSVFFYDNYYLTLTKKDTYELSWLEGGTDFYESGTWQWIDEKSSVYFKYTVDNSGFAGLSGGPAQPGEYSYEILKLKQKELWFKQIQPNGDVWELHFIPNKSPY